jgi:DDE superfamily endonuclease
LLKISRVHILEKDLAVTDLGYQGIRKIHNNSILPHKKKKKISLTKEQKRENQQISRDRVLNENVIGMIKRFKIISDRYRNRRKRFGLRFNLIAGIHNFELPN